MNRRTFLQSSLIASAAASLAATLRAQTNPTPAATPATAAAATSASSAAPRRRALKKGFMYSMLRGDTAQVLTVRQKFDLFRDAGFDGVEMMSAMNTAEVLAARDATGLEIPSVIITTHWARPLSDSIPSVRATGLEGLRQGLRDAKEYGAKSVLLVPAVVTKEVSYTDAYARSAAEIAKAIPLAESLGVVIAIENVWNRFLLSPREAVEYVDAFRSPFVRWHFDVGNVVNTGWPEHWIRTLGPRIFQIHVKEYSRKIRDTNGPSAGFNVDLLEGDSDWPAVMAALDTTGYKGWMIAEQWRPPSLTDAQWLKHLSQKMDVVIAS